ncbi:MAG: universal stress protein [Bacteroidota bacterium]
MNTLFKHILVPFDNSDSSRVALRMSVNLAQKFDSKLSMIYVETGKGEDPIPGIEEVIATVKKNTFKQIELIVKKGKMHKEVAKLAEEIDADLIAMGAHGMSGFEEFWIGSNAYRVVNSTNIPVLTMQEKFGKRVFNNIIVPIDDSKNTRQKVPMVGKLARAFNARVKLLVTSRYNDVDVWQKARISGNHSKELLGKEGVTAEVHEDFGGNTADKSIEFARQNEGDLIIMMSESSGGFFMGSNAQRVVNHSDIPVLTLHPKDTKVSVVGY